MEDGAEDFEGWSAEEVQLRGQLEQRLRAKPTDRQALVTLAALLATKGQSAEAAQLIEKAAFGLQSDPDAAALLRKLSGAKLALWKSLRASPQNPLYLNCDEERLQHARDAVAFAERAMTYPENLDNPAALIEHAQAKLAAGDLVGSLRDFSSVVSQHPAYPQLSAAIARAACLLAYLGDRPQAVQYLTYVLEDPPVSLGYGELEVRGLLLVNLVATGAATGDAVHKLYNVFGSCLKRATDLPEGFPTKPPEGTSLMKWAAPWRLLAERAMARCDYLAAMEFWAAFAKKDKQHKAAGLDFARPLVLAAEARYLLGDQVRALEDMEAVHAVAPGCGACTARLMEWAWDAWAPRLDAAVANALHAAAREAAATARRQRADTNGEVLRRHVARQRGRAALHQWLQGYHRHFAATTVARVARGCFARAVWRRLNLAASRLAANTKRVVYNIAKHLLRHLLVAWYQHWRTEATQRRTVATPLRVRTERRLLGIVLAAWHARARKQVAGKFAARLALKSLKDWGRRAPRGFCEQPRVFYSLPLVALASFPKHKKRHEDGIREVLEAKAIEQQILAEQSALMAEMQRAAEEEAALEAKGVASLPPIEPAEAAPVVRSSSPKSADKKKRRKKKK
jgi:tetratricopeptide (TPR) repeat protein